MTGSRSGFVHRLYASIGVLIAVATGGAFLVLGPAEAEARITTPFPLDAPPTPPPITALPPAGEAAPPPEVISDPITPEARCGSWHRQSNYGDRWPAGSTWWEFGCTAEYPSCSAICTSNYYPDQLQDLFYWDGSQPVFYGEFYGLYYLASLGFPDDGAEYWWDQPTARWYQFPLPPAEPPNATPTASFTVSCSASSCSIDGRASSDSDGTIENYTWAFGDGTTVWAPTAQHSYALPGSYTVTRTVTHNRGAWAIDSKLIVIEASPK